MKKFSELTEVFTTPRQAAAARKAAQPTATDRLGHHLARLKEHHKTLGEHIKNIEQLHKSGKAYWGHVGSAEAMADDIENAHSFNDTHWKAD